MNSRILVRNYLKKRWRLLVLVPAIALFYLWLPDQLFTTPRSSVLLDKNGLLLAARIADDGQWRFPELDTVPEKVKACILNFEDAFFRYHPGVNPVSLFRSLVTNIKSGKIKSGGSTITMQLSRMVRGNKSRNVYQKCVELLLALRIECSYSKSEILGLYCSHAPFGGNVVGLPAAAWRYFGRAPDQLSWAEAATLAVLPNAPSLIYPGKNQERLLKKRDRLLRKLCAGGIIDSVTCELAVMEDLPPRAFAIPQEAPHLLARSIVQHGAGKIFYSTVSRELQIRTNELLNAHIKQMSLNQVFNACALVAETESGRVLAYVGNSFSEKNEHENYVDVISSPRSTGSILKPFLYAFMLSDHKLLPNSLREDVPMRVGSYGPKNYSLAYDGLVPANEAVARSLNVPAVGMLQEYGTGRFHQRLKQLGFTTFNKTTGHYGLSLILGGGEASLWEIASAYAAMGRALKNYSNEKRKYAQNSYRSLHYMSSVVQDKPKVTLKSDLLSASSIYFTFKAMTELLRPQDYVGWRAFLSKTPVAWKTGTSFGFRDAWAVGVNGKYTVAVWVGNADGEGRPELTGTAAAAPLMFSIFNTLSEKEWFRRPSADFAKISVCRKSGYRASEICDDVVTEEVPEGAEITRECPFHKLVHLNREGTHRVSDDCYPVSEMRHCTWFVAAPVQEYFFRQRCAWYKPLPSYLAGCSSVNPHHSLEIIYPRENFQVYVPTDETGSKSRCILKATHKDAAATLFWYVDGDFIGSTQKFHQMPLIASGGKHILEVLDHNGESAICNFEVLKKGRG